MLACKSYSFVCTLHHLISSHYHHCANVIWRHWTYKMSVRYNMSSVWVRLSIFCQLSIIQHVGMCVFSLTISFVMIERIYILCVIIIIKSEVWTITHCLGLGHETMVCAVCLSIFLSIALTSHIKAKHSVWHAFEYSMLFYLSSHLCTESGIKGLTFPSNHKLNVSLKGCNINQHKLSSHPARRKLNSLQHVIDTCTRLA